MKREKGSEDAQKAQKERNKAGKVAQYANPRTKGITKAERRLEVRQADRERTLGSSKNATPEAYHKPGSLQ